MDNGASSYRRFLEGDDSGLCEIVRDYKDGLILFLHSMTRDLGLAEELCEDTFVRLAVKKPKFSGLLIATAISRKATSGFRCL